jgi:hypothetical protein
VLAIVKPHADRGISGASGASVMSKSSTALREHRFSNSATNKAHLRLRRIASEACSPAVFTCVSAQRELTPGGPGSGLRPGRKRFLCKLPLWFYIYYLHRVLPTPLCVR